MKEHKVGGYHYLTSRFIHLLTIQNKNPDNIYSQLIVNKSAKAIKSITFSTPGTGITGYLYAKKLVWTCSV